MSLPEWYHESHPVGEEERATAAETRCKRCGHQGLEAAFYVSRERTDIYARCPRCLKVEVW